VKTKTEKRVSAVVLVYCLFSTRTTSIRRRKEGDDDDDDDDETYVEDDNEERRSPRERPARPWETGGPLRAKFKELSVRKTRRSADAPVCEKEGVT
jgi:hypothetical protein